MCGIDASRAREKRRKLRTSSSYGRFVCMSYYLKHPSDVHDDELKPLYFLRARHEQYREVRQPENV